MFMFATKKKKKNQAEGKAKGGEQSRAEQKAERMMRLSIVQRKRIDCVDIQSGWKWIGTAASCQIRGTLACCLAAADAATINTRNATIFIYRHVKVASWPPQEFNKIVSIFLSVGSKREKEMEFERVEGGGKEFDGSCSNPFLDDVFSNYVYSYVLRK